MHRNHRKGLLGVVIGLALCGNVLAHAPRQKLSRIGTKADIVFAGTVTNISEREWNGGKMQFTDVTFADLQMYKQREGVALPEDGSIMLSFAGGSTIRVAHVPQFEQGARYLVAARYGGVQYISPIVGGDQGLFRLMPDAASGELRVLDHHGGAVVDVREGKAVFGNRPTAIHNGEGSYRHSFEEQISDLAPAPQPTQAANNPTAARAQTHKFENRDMLSVMSLSELLPYLLGERNGK